MRQEHHDGLQSPQRPTLLSVFPFAPGTGFTRVMASILEWLSGDWNLHCLATRGARGEQWIDGVTLHSGTAAPAQPGAPEDCRALVERVRPDAVLLLDDPPVVARYARALSACLHRPWVVAYCPVDGFLKSPQTLLGMEHVDRLVSFSLRLQGSLPRPPPAPRCLHRSQRQHVLSAEADGNHLVGFAAFAESKPENVRLYLHHLAPDRPYYADLMDLVHALGIAGRLIP